MTLRHGGPHSHGSSAQLEEAARGILDRGLAELLRLGEGARLRGLASEKHPLPLTRAAYADSPDARRVREDVSSLMNADPVDALDRALALFELHACNQPGVRESAAPQGRPKPRALGVITA